MIDPGPIIDIVANLVNDLNDEYGEDAELHCGVIVLELLEDEDSEYAGSIIEHRATTRSTATVLGTLNLATDSLRSGYDRGDDEVPDP
jgi:hypothetical protein